MSISLILLEQTVIMFLLAGIGFMLFKFNKISVDGSKTLGNILIHIVLPCVIIQSFLIERTKERIIGLAISALLAVIILFVSVFCSRICFKNDPIASFASSFSNPGFFGIPLIIASLGNDSVFYIASFIAFLNLLQWTYGGLLMSGKRSAIKLLTILKAPFMISILIGLLLFFSTIKLPDIILETLDTLTGVNTSLAMFTVGIYLAQTDLKRLFTKPILYAISAVRLLLIPIITLLLLSFVPSSWLQLKIALLIASACPVGSNVAVYAQLHDQNHHYAAESVVISTLLSLVTIPFIIHIANILF